MTAKPGHSLNYEFVVETARALAHGREAARYLDFGCGLGTVVALALDRGLDFHGVDTFDSVYEAWQSDVPERVRPRVHRYDDVLPFDDDSFDVVTANMVFEHIPDLGPPLREICRVLKAGGYLLAIFPVHATAYEGHAGLYGVHWLARNPRLQARYLTASHKLGFGLYRNGFSSNDWAAYMSGVLSQSCVYHRGKDVRRAFEAIFGDAPKSLAADYARFRLERSRYGRLVRSAPRVVLDPLLRAACALRVGKVIVIAKQDRNN